MACVAVEVPEDLLVKLKNENREAREALRRIAAFFLCSRGELSTSQAARLGGMTYADFLEAAAHAKVELFQGHLGCLLAIRERAGRRRPGL
jgi:hypothetical protein